MGKNERPARFYHRYQVALNAMLEARGDRALASARLLDEADTVNALIEHDSNFTNAYTTRLGMSIQAGAMITLWREAAELL